MQLPQLHPVAMARTPFQQKFAIPRQAGLVDYPSRIVFCPPYDRPEAVAGLDQVSHVWVTFVFDQHVGRDASLSVRPPRLGGNRKLGVFATRSSFRPNGIGQSLVALERIEYIDEKPVLHVVGLDLLDNTPVIDIKPYLPYADVRSQAFNHIASAAPELHELSVHWSQDAEQALQQLKLDEWEEYRRWISGLIELDPRPAYKKQQQSGEYGMAVFQLNIQWRHLSDSRVEIFAVTAFKTQQD